MLKKRKLIALITAFAFAMSLATPVNGNASVKPGGVCKKAGQTTTSAGKKYTCIKNGKKLVPKTESPFSKEETSEVQF
jgi:hypothetical protein